MFILNNSIIYRNYTQLRGDCDLPFIFNNDPDREPICLQCLMILCLMSEELEWEDSSMVGFFIGYRTIYCLYMYILTVFPLRFRMSTGPPIFCF